MVHGREIRELLRGKIDPALGKILVQMAEDARETRRMVVECAAICEQLTDTIATIVQIFDSARAAKMKEQQGAMDKLKEIKGPDGST
jgi:hypothetical protein